MADKTYQLLPPLAPDDYERLKDDIRLRGIQQPIEVDEDGNILDGHHRRRIADELGIDCPTVVKAGLDESGKRLHAGMMNLARRHLTAGQKVYVGRLIEPEIAAVAEQRRLEGGDRRRRSQQQRTSRQQPTLDGAATTGSGTDGPLPGQKQRVRDEVAQQVGLGSGDTYQRHKKVLDWAEREAPELVDAVAEGRATIPEVRDELRQRTLHRDNAEAADLLNRVVEASSPEAVADLRSAQRRADQSAAKAAVRRALAAMDPAAVEVLADPVDRTSWIALARDLRTWADEIDRRFTATNGLRLVE